MTARPSTLLIIAAVCASLLCGCADAWRGPVLSLLRPAVDAYFKAMVKVPHMRKPTYESAAVYLQELLDGDERFGVHGADVNCFFAVAVWDHDFEYVAAFDARCAGSSVPDQCISHGNGLVMEQVPLHPDCPIGEETTVDVALMWFSVAHLSTAASPAWVQHFAVLLDCLKQAFEHSFNKIAAAAISKLKVSGKVYEHLAKEYKMPRHMWRGALLMPNAPNTGFFSAPHGGLIELPLDAPQVSSSGREYTSSWLAVFIPDVLPNQG